MQGTKLFVYFILTLVGSDAVEEENSEIFVTTKKYQISGDDFVRNYYAKNKILRITDDYFDWPLYKYWWENDERLSQIPIDVSRRNVFNEPTLLKMTLQEMKQSKDNDIFTNHVISEDQVTLTESILVPLTILSCKDLYKEFLDTAIFSLHFTNSESTTPGAELFEHNTYVMIIDGKWHVSLCPNCISVTFGRGELIYIPKNFNMEKSYTMGSFLAIKVHWLEPVTNDDSVISCKPNTLQSANFKKGWSRNTSRAAQINSSRLNTGFEIPPIGFGTDQLYGKTYESVKHALKIGYRLIDTSTSYFGSDNREVSSESEIGKALRDSGIPRKDVLISVKIHIDMIKHGVANIIQQSLNNLQTTYIDILILEIPFRVYKHILPYPKETPKIWEDLKTLQKSEIIRNLGICNIKDITELRAVIQFTGDSLSVVQNWFDLFRLDKEIREECKQRGIIYIGYGTMGLKRMISEKIQENPVLTEEDVVRAARAIDITVGSLVLRWSMQQEVIVTPCSRDEFHIETNYYSTQIYLRQFATEVINTMTYANNLSKKMQNAPEKKIISPQASKDEL